MFTNFDDVEKSRPGQNPRLNKGVRGRLMDRLLELMDQKKMKGFDVNYIYEQTKNLPVEDKDGVKPHQKHTINFMCGLYLEKIKYFT